MSRARTNANNWAADIVEVAAGTGIAITGGTGPTATVAVDSTVATLSGSQTLTNKTIALGSNTVSGTTAQFNTALTDGDFATLAGSETLTNKTVTLGSNTVSGTLAQFNTALTDADFASIAGTETLTNKTLTSPVINLSTNAQAASYTLVLADNGRIVEISNAGAVTLTVPTDASVNFPVGSQINILQTGAGQITVGGAGVTINGTPGLKLRAQWSSATLIKRGTNTWVLVGDLSA